MSNEGLAFIAAFCLAVWSIQGLVKYFLWKEYKTENDCRPLVGQLIVENKTVYECKNGVIYVR